MSTTIDNKVVEMRFDNRQFESNVQTSMSTLDKLKQKLNLNDSAKGLENINAAARNVNMSGLGSAVESVHAKFSALQVMGVTALSNITNSAVNAGKKIVSALTIDPIKTGFQEYETQINAVQTILANTKSKGSTLDDVNKALDELNTYADKTIYNFTEMTRNIGTFTAAGVDLDKSVTSIKGIANLAAISGSTSQQASTAMYQLSQALASGRVNLQDWNSVVNAGMGGEVFQNALKRTAEHQGKNVDELIKKYGSFRESLTKGEWLTADVLTETLTQLSGAYSEADLIAQGYTKKQAKEITELADTAVSAATEVKTFTQLWDTLKEAAQSGWTQTWEIIVGDFEEAKSLLTEVSDTIGAMIGSSAEARNNMLQGWKDLGGRTALIDSVKNAFEGIMSIVKPIGEAFREIFPPITSKQLLSFTEGLKELTSHLKISDETADKLKRTFKGVFSIFDIFKKVIGTVAKAIAGLLGSEGAGGLVDFFLSITASIGDFFTAINKGFDIGGISGSFSKIVSSISDVLKTATDGLSGFGDILTSIGRVISKVVGNIWGAIKEVFGWIADNISAGDIFAGLAGGGIFVVAKKLAGLFGKVKDILENLFSKDKDGISLSDIKTKFADVLDSVHDSLNAFTSGIKISSLLSIAAAIGILSISLKTISKIEPGDIAKSLFAIGTMLTMLSLSFRSMNKSLKKFNSKGLIKSGIALILVAEAIKILSDALVKLSDLSMLEITRGLVAIGVGLVELSVGLKIIGKTKISLSTSVTILALAESCKILGDALSKFGKMSWDEIGRGLTAMGGALAELIASLAVMSKVGGGKSLLGSVSMLIAVQSLEELAASLKKFGEMAWDEIGRGLAAMGGALGELGIVVGALGKLTGFSGILGSGSILIAVQSLSDLVDALKQFGGMSWDEIGRGLAGMGGALGEVATISGLLGKLTGFSGILGSGSILIVVQSLADLSDAFKKFGDMAWDEIGRGLSAMGGALAELGIVVGVLGFVAPIGSLLGSGAILLGVQGLGDLADALKQFGEMTWDEITRGLSGMGGALIEVAVISGLLGSLSGLGGMLGSGALLLAIQGLGDLADAFKKFGEMDWEQVKTALAAMGGALGETALGGLLSTFSIFGAGTIAAMAEPLGALADSVKKWSGVTVPTGLGIQLAILSDGVSSFTFGGFGASAIAEVATPLGTLADSVKKWSSVTIPEGLESQLETLASGVNAFTFGGFGAATISSVAAPLGTMADSVRKWSSVTIPAGIEDGLTGLANGVKAWSWAFMGGWSIGTAVEPIKNLAGSIKAWSSVIIPEGIESKLTGLANGVKAWSWAFMGGWSISAVVEPLKNLAGAIKSWNGIYIPDGIEDKLKGLASGVESWSWAFVGTWTIGSVVDPLKKLAGAMKSWNGITIQSGLGDKLDSLATGVKKFNDISVGNLSDVCDGIKKIGKAAKDISGVNFGGIASKLTGFASSVNKIKISSSSFSNLGKKMVDGFVKSINSGKSRVQSAVTSLANTAVKSFSAAVSGAAIKSSVAGIAMVKGLITGMKSGMSTFASTVSSIINSAIKAITSKTSAFQTAGVMLITKLISGISSRKSGVSSAVSSLARSAASSARNSYGSFYSNGSYLGSGLVSGINSKKTAAYNAGYALGQAAVRGEKAGQKSNSPSKLTIQAGKWLGEGLVIGINKMTSKVYKSGYGLGDKAAKSMSNAIAKVSDVISFGIDVEPTIRPVIDLSDVENGAGRISDLFNSNVSIGASANINAISSMMNRRRQNGEQSEIVSAINKLRKDLGNVNNTTYSINGVTYDDGSNISDAVKTLVRAARVERRV